MSILGIIFGVVILLYWIFIAIGFLAHDPNEPIITTTIEIKRSVVEKEEDKAND